MLTDYRRGQAKSQAPGLREQVRTGWMGYSVEPSTCPEVERCRKLVVLVLVVV